MTDEMIEEERRLEAQAAVIVCSGGVFLLGLSLTKIVINVLQIRRAVNRTFSVFEIEKYVVQSYGPNVIQKVIYTGSVVPREMSRHRVNVYINFGKSIIANDQFSKGN